MLLTVTTLPANAVVAVVADGIAVVAGVDDDIAVVFLVGFFVINRLHIYRIRIYNYELMEILQFYKLQCDMNYYVGF